MRRHLLLPLAVLLVTPLAFAAPAPKPKDAKVQKPAPPPVLSTTKKKNVRYTARTPDAMLSLAADRAKKGGGEALAAIAVIRTLSDRAAPGVGRRALEKLGEAKGDVAEQARWVQAELEPQIDRAQPKGLVTGLAVLGPFQDTEGRVKARDIKEDDPATWADQKASYSWGVYDVRWRPAVLPVTARGVPLDAYIHPRKESCTYVASRVTLPSAGPIVVHLASTGAARLLWDGQDLASSEELNEQAYFDRLGARVEATAGEHLVAAKVCAGALEDAGRVRIRIALPNGEAATFESSADLSPLAKTTFAKAKARAIVEPLASALETGKRPSLDAALVSAILRTQGGADDLRSPRAPGLLESVAKGAPDADVLAMAGWVSPFGSERSGWLNLARDRALKDGDLEALDFATRRIVAARTDAGLGDWAMAAMNSEPLAKDEDVEAKLLRAHVRADVGGEAAKRAALTEMLRLASDEKTPASVAVWEEIARLARGIDPKKELDARDRLARISPERFDVDRVRAATAIDGEAVIRAAFATLEQGGLTDADDLADIGGLVVRTGNDLAAAQFFQKAELLAPNRSAVASGFAEALFATGKPDLRKPAEQLLARARDLEPGDARLRAELALRTKDETHKPNRDERWLVDGDKLLAAAKANPAKKGEVADRQVYWLRAVTQHEDHRVSQLIQYGREIVIAPRTLEELYEQIPIEGDDTEILRARVHRATGEIAFAEEAKSDYGRPMIRWPDLKTGDVVEVAIRSWTSGPIGRRGDPPFYVMDYGGSISTHPLLYNEVVLDLPKEHPLAVDILNGKADKVLKTEEGDRTITRFIWDKPVTFPDEPFAPKPSEIFPTLVISSFSNWDEFRQWYGGATAGFTEPDAQVRELAAELTKGKTTKEEKLKALFEFVADDIRYVNYVSGEWWLPNRPQQLLARRQGDCDDKAMLLITLLKAVGIDATEVLIQTRLTAQPSLLLSKKAAVPLFDHGIAYIPGKGGEKPIWLDATSPQSRLGPVPSMDTRTFALFANEGPAQMVATPKGSPDDYGSDATWVLTLARDGSVDLDADELHRGDQAFFLRTALREPDSRAQWVEQNLVAGWIPQVVVDKNVDFQPDLVHGQARVKYKAKSLAFGRMEGADLVVTLAPSSTLASQLAPLPRRMLPVVLPPQLAPSKQSSQVRLVAPEGMKPGELPPGGEENGGDFGRAKLEVALDPKDPRVVVLTRSVVFDLETIPVDRYAAWRTWLSRVDSLLHRAVRFVPASEKGAAK